MNPNSQKIIKRSEYLNLLRLTTPMIVSSFATILIGATDTAFIGRVGITALAAVSVAAAIYSVLSQIIASSTSGYQILAARRFGGGESEAVANGLLHSLAISLPLGLLGCALLWVSAPLIGVMTHDASVVSQALLYLKYRSPALVALALVTAIGGTLDTARQTQWGMYASALAIITNGVLDYFLIFGIGPFPQMGVAGAGLASTLAVIFSTIFIVVVLIKKRLLPKPKLTFQWHEMCQQIRLSFPEISSAALDYAGNLIFVTTIGFLGSTALAGGRIAFQILLILFIISSQFGVGIKILMGHSLGSKNSNELLHRFSVGRTTSFVIMIIFGIPLIVYPEAIARIFTPSSDVLHIAAGAIRMVGLCAPLMALTTSCSGALRSHGKTKWLMYSNLSAIWLVQIPIALVMGVYFKFEYGLTGIYIAFLAYFLVRAVTSHFLVRSIHTNFKTASQYCYEAK